MYDMDVFIHIFRGRLFHSVHPRDIMLKTYNYFKKMKGRLVFDIIYIGPQT